MGSALLALAVVAWVAGYSVACWIWPFKACPRCKGTGRRRSPTGKRFRLCGRCDGTGRRLRTGRRIYNFFCEQEEGPS
jgi:DnaJ-class molecular chaperone